MVTIHDNVLWTEATAAHPEVTLVVSCFNVAQYLPAFLASLDAQDCSPDQLEVVVVVDGSPDQSEQLIERWMQRTRFATRMVVQENQGLSGARNTGVEYGRGTWVSFPDPDDEISVDYVTQVLAAATLSPGAEAIVARLVRLDGEGTVSTHPLDFKFASVKQGELINLTNSPHMIQLQAASTFLRLARLKKYGLEFETRLRKGFEDAHLIARYFMTLEKPQYIMAPEAHYYYYLRTGSIISLSKSDYTKFIDVVEFGYLDLLRTYADGGAPRWLGNLVLYDMWWLFREYRELWSPVFAMSQSSQQVLDRITRKVLTYVGPVTISKFCVIDLPLDVRAAWLNAAGTTGVSEFALLGEFDRVRGLQKIYCFSDAPTFEADVLISGVKSDVPFQRARELRFFEKVWAYEHILWVCVPESYSPGVSSIDLLGTNQSLGRSGEMLVRAEDDVRRELKLNAPPKGESTEGPVRLRRARARWLRAVRLSRAATRVKYAINYRLGRMLGWHRADEGAWVLTDRDTQAHDNGEALYRHLVAHRPDINIRFVLNRDSRDWDRLESEGFCLIPFRSARHFNAMKQAKFLISSQADEYVIQPFPVEVLAKTWQYVFLQHGVIHSSLERWLNPKEIDLIVTSTASEYASLLESPGRYVFTGREVALTGQPRHDRLQQLIEAAPQEAPRRPRIVIMPTWRNYLLKERVSGGNKRVRSADFFESEFVRNWHELLNGPLLSQLSADPNVDVIFLPHPNIDEHWTELDLPEGMRRVSYADGKAQEILAGTTLAITDYSSQAFEAAFCMAPTVYFQFDAGELFNGEHISSRGYFDFARNGFGPVCASAYEVEECLPSMLAGTHRDSAEYLARVRAAFPMRDSSASKRVVAEIEARGSRYSTNALGKRENE